MIPKQDLQFASTWCIFVFIIYYFISFCLYIYFSDLQENVGGAIHKPSKYHNLLPEMPRYRSLVEIFFLINHGGVLIYNYKEKIKATICVL